MITLIPCDKDCLLYRDLAISRGKLGFSVKLRIVVYTVFEYVVYCGKEYSCYGNDGFLVAATLFEAEIAVANLRMLFAGNDSIGTLHKQWLDVVSGHGDPDRFFLPRTFIYQYLYTLLLYVPDYKEELAGIKQLLLWSGFIKERCSGITDTEKERPETRGNLPV